MGCGDQRFTQLCGFLIDNLCVVRKMPERSEGYSIFSYVQTCTKKDYFTYWGAGESPDTRCVYLEPPERDFHAFSPRREIGRIIAPVEGL